MTGGAGRLDPVDKPSAPDPRDEALADAPVGELKAALDAALEVTRAAAARPLPPQMNVDWAATEHSIRLGLLIEHLLGGMDDRERLIYELHVVRTIGAWADGIHVEAQRVADEREAQQRRATLLGGMGAVPRRTRPNGGPPL